MVDFEVSESIGGVKSYRLHGNYLCGVVWYSGYCAVYSEPLYYYC